MGDGKTMNGLAGAVRIVCILALMLVSFAHRPVTFAAADDVRLAAAALPDGSFPDLCLADYGTPGSQKFKVNHCEFCRIAGGVVLPLPVDGADADLPVAIFLRVPPADPCPVRPVYAPNAPLRGPPALSI